MAATAERYLAGRNTTEEWDEVSDFATSSSTNALTAQERDELAWPQHMYWRDCEWDEPYNVSQEEALEKGR